MNVFRSVGRNFCLEKQCKFVKIKNLVSLAELIQILTFINEQTSAEECDVPVLIKDEFETIRTTDGNRSKSGVHDICDVKIQTAFRVENNVTTKKRIVTLCFIDRRKVKKITDAN